jgi:hypothetical protein
LSCIYSLICTSIEGREYSLTDVGSEPPFRQLQQAK